MAPHHLFELLFVYEMSCLIDHQAQGEQQDKRCGSLRDEQVKKLGREPTKG